MKSSKLSLDPKAKILIKAALKVAKQKKVKLYIVGGYLRDILLGREKENPDIDFAIQKNAINFGREVARQLKAGFVILDKEHGCSRVVKKAGDKLYTLDFTDFRGKTLEDDLLHRDFTINAFCLEPEKLFKSAEIEDCIEDAIIDPYKGRRDLRLKLIRLVNKKAFDEDPLRILRAFSLAITFGFKIDKETLKQAGLKANKLSGVSYERIRDELFKILTRPGASEYLELLDKLKILKVILSEIEVMRGVGQGPYHHLDVWQHSLETVRQLEKAILEFKRNREIQDYLDRIISPGRSRRALLKFGALLHDIGKPKSLRREDGKLKFHGHERVGTDITKAIAERLRLSNDEMAALKKMVLWHLRPGYLADNDEVTPRAIFRYFRDTQDEALSVLLLSLGDQRATKGRLTTKDSRLRHEKLVARLIKEYFSRKKEKKLVRLLNGNDLMNKFKLQPSPLIGKILSEIEELQAIGKIKNKQEALREAKKYIRDVPS
jgi:poly(A) polymerase